MAEFGDALSTAISQSDSEKPSIFEVLAQDNLNVAVRPAIRHLIKVRCKLLLHDYEAEIVCSKIVNSHGYFC